MTAADLQGAGDAPTVLSATATLTVDGADPLGELQPWGDTPASTEVRAIQVFDAPATGGVAEPAVSFETAESPLKFSRSLTLP